MPSHQNMDKGWKEWLKVANTHYIHRKHVPLYSTAQVSSLNVLRSVLAFCGIRWLCFLHLFSINIPFHSTRWVYLLYCANIVSYLLVIRLFKKNATLSSLFHMVIMLDITMVSTVQNPLILLHLVGLNLGRKHHSVYVAKIMSESIWTCLRKSIWYANLFLTETYWW